MEFLSTAFIFLLAFLLVREFQTAMASLRTERWKTTTGKLTSGVNTDNSTSLTGKEKVRYEYEVDSVIYTSERIALGFPDFLNSSWGKRLVARLEVEDSTVRVFYDPRKPESCTLLTGFHSFHVARIAPLVVLLVYLLAKSL